MKDKPLGVTVLVYLYLVMGILSIIWGFLVLGFGGMTSVFGNLFNLEGVINFANASAWSGFLSLITGALELAVAWGLSALKKWAWYLALVGVGLTAVQGLTGLFEGTFAFICGVLGLLAPVIILVYLLSKDVRKLFGV
jgi:uncharacterized membrane protein (DUF2068 family)